MFGKPIARVAQPLGEPRQIQRIMQGRGAGRGRGDRRQIEDGQWDHANSLRMLRAPAAISAPAWPASIPPSCYWAPRTPAVAPVKLYCAAGAAFSAARWRLTTTRRTVCVLWVASVRW